MSRASHYPDVTYGTQKGVELANAVGESLKIAHGQVQGLSSKLSMLVPMTQDAILMAMTSTQLFLDFDRDRNFGAEAMLNVRRIIDNIDSAKSKAHSMRIYFPKETAALHETLCDASLRANKLNDYFKNHVRYVNRAQKGKFADTEDVMRQIDDMSLLRRRE